MTTEAGGGGGVVAQAITELAGHHVSTPPLGERGGGLQGEGVTTKGEESFMFTITLSKTSQQVLLSLPKAPLTTVPLIPLCHRGHRGRWVELRLPRTTVSHCHLRRVRYQQRRRGEAHLLKSPKGKCFCCVSCWSCDLLTICLIGL